jgi:hypothetical protein
VDRETRRRRIEEHREAIRRLEETAADEIVGWPPHGYYLLWHVAFGLMIGALGALVALAANAAGAPLFGRRPLELIRVFLTFPMGQRALDAEPGLVLSVGCTLYLLTGALLGVAYHLGMSLWFAGAPPSRRIAVTVAFGLGLWIVSFYMVLSWLQLLLQGDDWIVRLVPWWVAALTHLAFAGTMYVAETWGRFEPYRRRTGNGDG